MEGCRIALGHGKRVEGSVANVGIIRREIEFACNGHPCPPGWLWLRLQPSVCFLNTLEGRDSDGGLLSLDFGEIVLKVTVARQAAGVCIAFIDDVVISVCDQDVGGDWGVGVL